MLWWRGFITYRIEKKVQENLVFKSVRSGARFPGVESSVSLPSLTMGDKAPNLSVPFFYSSVKWA